MKFYRTGINETEIEVSDAELEELAKIIELAIEHLEEYNDLRMLREHDRKYYRNIAVLMRKYARYE